MFIDTHGHLNLNAFKDDAEGVLERTLASGMRVIMPGTQYANSKRAVELASGREGAYAAVGIHPIHLGGKRKVDVLETESENREGEPWNSFTTREEAFDSASFEELASHEKTVAVGEVGLDYYYQPKGTARREEYRAHQWRVLEQQVKLAQQRDLPVIFHCRVAHEDLLSFLSEHKGVRGVVHSFTGTVKQADEFMNKGMYLGFNGLIFKDVPALPDPFEVISHIPLARILLETDAPYLAPPQVKEQRNEPLYITYAAERIAEIRRTSVQEVAEATSQNAGGLFSLTE